MRKLMGCFFVRFKNNKPVLHLSKFQINPLASGLIERNIKAKGEHLFLELSAPQWGLLCALCSPSWWLLQVPQSPTGKVEWGGQAEKGLYWSHCRYLCFTLLKQAGDSVPYVLLGFFFQTWKTFSPHALMDAAHSTCWVFSSSCSASSCCACSVRGETDH